MGRVIPIVAALLAAAAAPAATAEVVTVPATTAVPGRATTAGLAGAPEPGAEEPGAPPAGPPPPAPAAPAEASARPPLEWAIDLYGGRTATRRASLDTFDFTIPAGSTVRADFDDGSVVGVRAVLFAPSLRWLGGAADVSWFDAAGDEFRIRLVPVSLLAVVRAPLFPSAREPAGWLQPYIAAGLSYAFVDLEPRAAAGASEATAGTGVDLRSGLRLPLTRRLGLVAEYRFTSIRIESEDEFRDSGAITRRTEGRLRTHHLVAGLSLRF